MRLLLIEDDDSQRELLALDFCRSLPQVEVVTAKDGIEGVCKFITDAVANPFDAVLTDVSMPNLSGFGVVRSVRAIEQGLTERVERRPVLLGFLTALGDTVEGTSHAAQYNVTLTLHKPRDVVGLPARVWDWMTRG